jgi:NADP-dependent 3-hydroxy acid dehydrogenase YdfG
MPLALVTGASSGVGRATAIALRARGWEVIAVARRESELAALAQDCGAETLALNAADPEAVDRLAATLKDRCPDVIVNAAGAGRWHRLEDTSPAEARAMMDAPFFAAFLVTRAFLPPMLKRGAGQIIHVNSPAAYQPWPHSALYAASRGALRSIHEALRQDLAGSGVISSHITFGKVSSDYFAANPGTEERLPRIAKTFRTLSPEACATLILRLIDRPRAEAVHPPLMAFYLKVWRIWPGLVRWLIRITSPRP